MADKKNTLDWESKVRRAKIQEGMLREIITRTTEDYQMLKGSIGEIYKGSNFRNAYNKLKQSKVIVERVEPIVSSIDGCSRFLIMVKTKGLYNTDDPDYRNQYTLANLIHTKAFIDKFVEKIKEASGMSDEDIMKLKDSVSIRNVYIVTGGEYDVVIDAIGISSEPPKSVADFIVFCLRVIDAIDKTSTTFVAHSSFEDIFSKKT